MASAFGVLSRLRGRAGLMVRIVMITLTLLLAGGFVWSALYDRNRTVLLEVQTRATDLTFRGNSNSWSFPRATICTPLPQGFDPARARGDGPCDARRFDVAAPQEVTVVWSAGTMVRAERSPQALSLQIVSSTTADLPDNARIHIANADLDSVGALTFAAEVTAGAPMATGAQQFLLGGTWEIRQAGWAISPASRDVSEVVKSGEAVRGSTLRVEQDCQNTDTDCGTRAAVLMFGHLSPGEEDAGPFLNLVALSARGQTELAITYFGARDATIVRPSLIDIAITSPLLLALAFALSILASVSQIFSDLASRRSDAKGQN